MRLIVPTLAALMTFTMSCGSGSNPAPPPPQKAAAPTVSDESQRFPKDNLVSTRVVDKQLLGKPFMPGGTLAHYKNGKTEYDMFAGKLPNANAAAILLIDWHKALADSHTLPMYGGYFGNDGNTPVFVFTRGAWIAGIAGLPEKQADIPARLLAAELR